VKNDYFARGAWNVVRNRGLSAQCAARLDIRPVRKETHVSRTKQTK
jgi:hypothetical protein